MEAEINRLLNEINHIEEDTTKPLKVILFKAKVGEAIWLWDEKRARELFSAAFKAASDFSPDKKGGVPGESRQLTLRGQILDSVLRCDTEFADELVRALAPPSTSMRDGSPDFHALAEQATLQLKIARAKADKEPQRAAQLIT